MSPTPLAVLDLIPIATGSTAAAALHNTIDLSRQTERFGYARYWVAEHHFNPGVASTSPAVVLALAASATSTIRIGAGAVQMGHRTALSVVEEFGLLDALHPGRLDLGLGRSPSRSAVKDVTTVGGSGVGVVDGRAPNGLRIPRGFSVAKMIGSPLFAAYKTLLQQPNAETRSYAAEVDDILALLSDAYRSPEGVEIRTVPGAGADVQVWVFGSSGGESAQVAGKHGLRFAANYHVSPSTILDSTTAYRAAFQPSAELVEPYLAVSADVVVAEDEGTARDLATGYGLWVRSIRSAEGAIEFPTPDQAREHAWTDEERALVADRVETQFVGTPEQVADQLEVLRDATGANELVITTITHDHADRVRSYRLLAEEWQRRGA